MTNSCRFLLLFIVFTFPLISKEIAVVSMALGKEYLEAVKLGLQNKQDYCAQHGYDFICEKEVLDPTRSLNWNKIPLLLKVMENSEYKWIFWTDADALIMNTGILLENLLDEKYNFIINNDFNGFNAGHFLIKNCEQSRQFLKDAYTHEEFIDDQEWEQGAMLATLHENVNYSSATKVVQQRLMNSFTDALGNYLQATYQPGDFILHFVAVRQPQLLKTYFERYYPLAGDQTKALTYEHYLGIYGITNSPENSPLFIWSTETQNKQYAEQLSLHPEIHTIAQVGLSNGVLAELFFKNCPNLTQSTAYVMYKRYDPFCRATCDYLSHKYNTLWKEAPESAECIKPTATAFDLIHIQDPFITRSLNLFTQVKKIADSRTLIWIHDYNIPKVQENVANAVNEGLLEIIAIHKSTDEKGFRSWAEARFK